MRTADNNRNRRRWAHAARLLILALGVALVRPNQPISALRDLRFVHGSGANLPWLRYGWDVGANPWGGPPGGFASNRRALDRDFAYLRSHNVAVCRVFLFADFRTGLTLNVNGIAGPDPWVHADVAALISSAREHRLKLIPVLIDHTIADGVSRQASASVGEHPEFIASPVLRRQLIDRVLAPIVRQHHDPHTIVAWDLFNEPRLATAVGTNDCMRFIDEAAAAIRAQDPRVRLTFGAYDRFLLDDLGGRTCDFLQVHYYRDLMEDYWKLDTPARVISDTKAVLLGEADLSDPATVLRQALEAGYAGVLFWSLRAPYAGIGFRDIAGDYAAWTQHLETRANRLVAAQRSRLRRD